jgi:hypothetical protein
MSSNIKVMLAPTAADARALAATLLSAKVLFSTVEAEYGSVVVEGTHETLAHHTGKWRENPAPCNWKKLVVQPDGVIIISHIDLDTVGGVLALMGLKPENDRFWAAAEYIDLNGPHRMSDLDKDLQEMLNGFECWKANQKFRKVDGVVDVTSRIELFADMLQELLAPQSPAEEKIRTRLLEEGAEWAERSAREVEECLGYESDKLRIFVTRGVFCAASYWSPNRKVYVPTTLTLDTRSGSITLANMDGTLDCCAVMQEAFGPEAGGHKGIAGTPRNERYSLSELMALPGFVSAKMREAQRQKQ